MVAFYKALKRIGSMVNPRRTRAFLALLRPPAPAFLAIVKLVAVAAKLVGISSTLTVFGS